MKHGTGVYQAITFEMGQSISLKDGVARYRKEFLAMSHITERQIRDFWLEQGDEKVADDELANIKYHYMIPLYQKMIFRFRNCGGCISRFWNQIDPNNRFKLLARFDIRESVDDTMNFFAWIKNLISGCELGQLLEKNTDLSKDDVDVEIQRWQDSNAIQYFFESSPDFQEVLFGHYDQFMSQFASD